MGLAGGRNSQAGVSTIFTSAPRMLVTGLALLLSVSVLSVDTGDLSDEQEVEDWDTATEERQNQ